MTCGSCLRIDAGKAIPSEMAKLFEMVPDEPHNDPRG